MRRWRILTSRFGYRCAVISTIILSFIVWFWLDICLWRADAELANRRLFAAERWIQLAQLSRSHPDQVCLLKLRLARRQGDFKRVEQLLLAAQNLHVPAKELRRQQLLAMAQTNQFGEVAKYWPELLTDPRDDEPEIARSYVIWASSYHLINDAIQVLTVWEKDYPLDPEPFVLHGQMAQALNHDEGAITAYRRALELDPNNDRVRLALATVLQNRLQLDEAASLYRECLKREPEQVAALKGLAITYGAMGEPDRASEILDKAVKRYPDDLELHKALAEILISQGHDAAALAHIERYHRAYPENASAAYSLASVLKALKREAEATALFEFVAESQEPLARLKSLEEKISQNPQDVQTRFEIAKIVAKYKSREEAIRWLEKLLLVAPSYRPAHELLIELFSAANETDKAEIHRKLLDGNSSSSSR